MPTLTAIPTQIQAGDSYDITLSLPSYPAPTWTLSLAIAGPSVDAWTSTASGTAHLLTLSSTDTAALPAGPYQYRVRASATGQVDTIETGTLDVLADIGAMRDGEGVSYWQTLKTDAEAYLRGILSGQAVQMSMVLSRQTMFRVESAEDCLKLIAYCEQRLARERRGSAFGKVMVTFAR